jgi:hypothetical protein
MSLRGGVMPLQVILQCSHPIPPWTMKEFLCERLAAVLAALLRTSSTTIHLPPITRSTASHISQLAAACMACRSQAAAAMLLAALGPRRQLAVPI